MELAARYSEVPVYDVRKQADAFAEKLPRD